MANEFVKAEQVVSMGLGMLQRELILPRLVKRLGIADFKGSKDDTVNVRVPAILTAREYGWRNDRSSPIVLDSLGELSIPVTLDKDPYSAVAVTDEELTLDIADFGEQVLAPQIRAVAEKLESYITATMTGGTYAEEITVTDGDDFIDDVTIEARRILNLANVPVSGRVIVLGANVEAWALKNDVLKRADQSGTDTALREATLGRVTGFTIVGNVNSIDPDEAYAFHPTAYAFANVAPDNPRGATQSEAREYQGLAMRWLQDYDPMHLQDRSVVSAFAGTASIADERDPDDGSLTGNNVRSVKINFSGS